MQIAVDARFLQDENKPELRDFTKEVFERLSVQHPTHNFIFFIDQKLNLPNALPANVSIVTLTPKPTNFLLYKWWYDVMLAFSLKKHKANVFIATYGLGSLTTSVKQILIVRDLAFLHKMFFVSGSSSRFYQLYTLRFAKKSAAIVTLSNFIKEELITRCPTIDKSIGPTFSGTADFFKPVDWEEREGVKEQFAEGCEYFIFSAGADLRANFFNVLKAFSIFKKWQKTNMKLLVAGTFDTDLEKDLEKLDTYKYRRDVVIKKDISQIELAKLIAASYALVYVSFYDGFAIPVLNAIQCEVPVIGSINSSIKEIADNAALYADPAKPESISEQMKRIFKDEQLRTGLVNAARQRKKLFNWDITARLLWKVVEGTVSQ